MRKILSEAIESFTILDNEGLPVKEKGSIPEVCSHQLEHVSSIFDMDPNASYIHWRSNNLYFISMTLEDGCIFLGTVNKDYPMTKLTFFIDDLRAELSTTIREL